ncbi:MAG: hydroxymethylbilane synthase [Deltaproteobacteria bacterium]|nr:hydroxymethylbilane synthase [Deltaproteobacteria bacterium]
MTDKRHKSTLRLGTRASLLALRQANWIKHKLEDQYPEVEVDLVHIKTEGDKIDVPLFALGGKGLFVKEIEEALLRGEVDMAVHSGKDLPVVMPQALALIAFPEREDPRDILISRNGRPFAEIPPGGKVGTSSLRRQAQLLYLRPDLKIVPLRGNLDTRIKKLSSLNLDAVILASAGLRRMGWEDRVSEFFEPEVMLPAIGQGVLAIEARVKDERVHHLLAFLNHLPTQLSLMAERAFLKRLGGGCQVPIAGLAQVSADRLHLTGLVATLDGQKVVRGKVEGHLSKGEDIGGELAEELMEKGAREILSEVYKKG